MAATTVTTITKVMHRACCCVLEEDCWLGSSLVRSICNLGLLGEVTQKLLSEELINSDPRFDGMFTNEQELSLTKTTVLLDDMDSRDICLTFWVLW